MNAHGMNKWMDDVIEGNFEYMDENDPNWPLHTLFEGVDGEGIGKEIDAPINPCEWKTGRDEHAIKCNDHGQLIQIDLQSRYSKLQGQLNLTQSHLAPHPILSHVTRFVIWKQPDLQVNVDIQSISKSLKEIDLDSSEPEMRVLADFSESKRS